VNYFLEVVFALIRPFAGHPEKIACVAAVFLASYTIIRSLRRKVTWMRPQPALVPAVMWGLWAFWEVYARDCNIRIDLVFGGPLLLLITAVSLAACFRFGVPKASDSRDAN
jgi:hypothetical protein